MSWQDNIENNIFVIITGDGKEYKPKWKNASKDVDYNSSIFEFVNVEGSLILRQKPKGRKFDLEFYFDGENSVDMGNNFEFSARNNNYWLLKHPFYGDIKCQPLSLRQDNSDYNISKFNVTVQETITDKYPEFTPAISDQISENIEIVNENQAQALSDSKELDRNELQENVNMLDNTFSNIIIADEDLKEFKSAVSDALVEIIDTTSTTLSIIHSIQTLINYPATIEQTVESRFTAISEAFDNLINTFTGNKNQFEALGGSLIASMQLASSTNYDSDYETRNLVALHQEKLLSKYNEYIEFLDLLQTDRADSDDSYIPNFSGINSLNELVNLSISNLFNIAFSAKQEREFTLDVDSNVILLTHRFLGLDKNDENLTKFITINNIGLTELINIKKGRKIIYYV